MAPNTHAAIVGSTPIHRRRAVRGTPVSSSEPVRISVLVRRRQPPPVSALPSAERSPHFTRAEFARLYGADPADLDRVATTLEGYGLRVVERHAGRRTIVVEGTSAQASAAFNVSLAHYTAGDDVYRGHEGPVHVPVDIANLVDGVFGLDAHPVARPFVRRATPAVASNAGDAVAADIPSGAIQTAKVAEAYSFPPNTSGTGQAIGILEFGGGFLDTDVTDHFNAIKVKAPTVVTVSVDKAANSPSSGAATAADDENALDLQVAGACAPGATIVMYFAPNTNAGWVDAITTAAQDSTNAPSVLSISWGASEDAWDLMTRSAVEQALSDAAAMAVTVCIASGDRGASGLPKDSVDELAHVDFPASAPHALACGGTRLDFKDGKPVQRVWNHDDAATGGGISDVFGVPFYQVGVALPSPVNHGAGAGRGVPDVASNADPDTGFIVRVHGKDIAIGGTSAAAPLWAALIARLNEALRGPVGFVNPALYRLLGSGSAAFTDITNGNNDVGHDSGGYRAGAGWDPCTGLGTPIGTALLATFTRSRLATFMAPNQITCGYSDSSLLMLDKTDSVPIDVALISDDPTVVTVPPLVTITPPSMSAVVPFQALAVAVVDAFPPKNVPVHALYGGARLSIQVGVAPPRIVSLTLSPATISAGDSATATVTLDRASKLGEVRLRLFIGAPGFAALPDPPEARITEGGTTATFTITSKPSALSFPAAHVSILAVHATASGAVVSSASATLTVQPTVVTGIVSTVTLLPASVTAGGTSHGTVTLTQAVKTQTVVALLALEPDPRAGGQLPIVGHPSTVAVVSQPTITIGANQTSGTFTVSTNHNVPAGGVRTAVIMAGASAGVAHSALLTVTN